MKISQKGLYALQGLMVLARRYTQGAIRIRDIAYEENLPEKFLELILLELKNARIVESVKPSVLVSEGIWPPSAFLDGWGINVLVGDDSVAPYGGAAFHDVSVWARRV